MVNAEDCYLLARYNQAQMHLTCFQLLVRWHWTDRARPWMLWTILFLCSFLVWEPIDLAFVFLGLSTASRLRSLEKRIFLLCLFRNLPFSRVSSLDEANYKVLISCVSESTTPNIDFELLSSAHQPVVHRKGRASVSGRVVSTGGGVFVIRAVLKETVHLRKICNF